MRNLRQLGHWISRVTSYSTQTLPISSHTLYRRLQGCYDPSISIKSVLDQWVVDGRSLDHKELISVVRSFRKNRRFGHALEVVEWMSSMKNFNITPGYAAARLALISKVHGTEQAESYFNSLDKDLKTLPVYGALLNCYTKTKSMDKAEAVLEQIRKLGFPNTLACNRMLSLYSQMGQYEKLNLLVREMEVIGIPFDRFSNKLKWSPVTTEMRNLQQLGPSISIKSVLDQWVIDGRSLNHKELISVVKSFRKNRRFRHALEIVEWMSSMKNFNIMPGYAAIGLDLISKVHSVEQAESYFNSLDKNVQTLPVYGALLNCYTNSKSMDKAEAVLEQIRKSGSPTTLICNRMLSLYSQMGEYKKLDSLLREMEETGIPFDKFSYNLRLIAYATSSDITQMEKLLMKMETDPFVTVSFCTYTTVAKGYIKIGALQKASAALKKAEHLISPRNIISDCEVLINIYTTLKRKEDVHRIRNLLKRDRKMISMA